MTIDSNWKKERKQKTKHIQRYQSVFALFVPPPGFWFAECLLEFSFKIKKKGWAYIMQCPTVCTAGPVWVRGFLLAQGKWELVPDTRKE